MEAPKCKICEGRHYGMCPVGDIPLVRKSAPIIASNKDVLTPDPVLTDVLTRNAIACKKWRDENKDSYNSYMRSYMRRKRGGNDSNEGAGCS